tara:strand:+ start:227 stop:403 length:177 start_codon:yes stop_codon:yes gene_type:complete
MRMPLLKKGVANQALGIEPVKLLLEKRSELIEKPRSNSDSPGGSYQAKPYHATAEARP